MTTMTKLSTKAMTILASVAACLGVPASGAETPAAQAAAIEAETHSAVVSTVEVGTLPPQELGAGQCGLFLWTNASEPRLVFASLTGGNARMMVNGQELALARNAAEGQEIYGQFESQHFYSEAMDVALNIVVERRVAITDGAVVPSATLRVKERNGWETVIPAGGLIGCEA
jgi:hypothetical protein